MVANRIVKVARKYIKENVLQSARSQEDRYSSEQLLFTKC